MFACKLNSKSAIAFDNDKRCDRVFEGVGEGFKKYLIFYRATDSEVEVLRVLHGARYLEAILDEDSTEDSEGE